MVVIACLMSLASLIPAHAATKYVSASFGSDLNPGTLAQPYKTIKKGVQNISSGDTLYLMAGTYTDVSNDRLDDIIPSGISASQPTVITTYGSDLVTIKPTSAPGYALFRIGLYAERYDIVIKGADYLPTPRLVFDLTLSPPASGISIYGWSGGNTGNPGYNILIENVEIIGGGKNGDPFIDGSGAINSRGGGAIMLDGHHNTVRRCKISGYGSYNASGYGNRYDWGVYGGGNHNIVEYCELFDCSGGGLKFQKNSGGADDNIARFNKVHGNGHNGLSISGWRNEAYGNLVWNNGRKYDFAWMGGHPCGIFIGLAHYAKIYNNTVWNNYFPSGTGYGVTHTYTSHPAYNIVRNNIAYAHPTADWYDVMGGSTTNTWDHNVFGWASPASDSKFVSLTDTDADFMKLASGATDAVDQGTAISGPAWDGGSYALDFWQTARPQGSDWDVGAHEYASISGPATLVAWWRLDEGSGTSANDSSGNGNTGTLNGPSWGAGQVGSALSFDGTDDGVNGGSDASLDNLSAVSVSAWIKPSGMGEGGYGRIIQKGSGTTGWRMLTRGTNQVEFSAEFGTTDVTRVSATNSISLNVWNHVVATWSGSSAAADIRLYVNGIEVSYALTTDGVGTPGNDASTDVHLGNEGGGTRTFNGLLDDVRVYGGELNATEALALYTEGTTAPAAPTSLAATKAASPDNYRQINLSWVGSYTATGYKIERKKGAGGTYSEIDTVGANVVTYNDDTCGAGTTYIYRVRAYNGYGNGTYSTEASATTDEITSGRRGHWQLEDGSGTSVADSSGNGNNGTLTGAAWVSGQIGGGVNFDGVDDVVACGSSLSLDDLVAQGGAGMTLCAWIKVDALGGGGKGRVLQKSAGVGTGGWWLYVSTDSSIAFDADFTTVNFSRPSANNALGSLPMSAFRHVVVTWDGSATATNAKIYLDGVEVSYGTPVNGSGSRVSDAAYNLNIGNEAGGSRAFDGVIDDVRAYNRILSADEITAIYRAGL